MDICHNCVLSVPLVLDGLLRQVGNIYIYCISIDIDRSIYLSGNLSIYTYIYECQYVFHI